MLVTKNYLFHVFLLAEHELYLLAKRFLSIRLNEKYTRTEEVEIINIFQQECIAILIKMRQSLHFFRP